ncbi:MAG: cyclic nucleotide-binding domain-containing protein [Actinomycetota bacterium]|nr:cyclic nucleotide-binding domain-containing protein [Actinomycetota bacterium]
MDPGRLKRLPLFQEVSDEELSHISPFVDETSVTAGYRLVNEGDYSYQFMAIEEGTAEVLRGGEHLADLGPGDFFGEMGLLEKDRRNASVVATSDLRAITMTGWDLKRLEKAAPEVAARIQRTLDERREAAGG